MTIKLDNRMKLSDGKTLGYAEYGDPQGRPVLHFHGMPCSRFEGHSPAVDEIASRLQARVIIVERPGFGLSDFKPYTIASWPDLVVEFADKLNLERFAVMGLSSGGKYVAACAWKIPHRLTAASISGTCAYDLPGAKETLSQQDSQFYFMADKLPWLFRILLGKVASDARKDPKSILSLFSAVSEPDQQALAIPDVQQLFTEMVLGAFHQGTRGVAWDWKLEARPWGSPISETRFPINVSHGEQDMIVPVEQGRIMAKALPNTRARYYPNDGHVSIMVNHYEELLGEVIC